MSRDRSNSAPASGDPGRVLLIGPFPPPFGGPNVHMLHLRRHLEAAGLQCAVLNIGPSRREAVAGATPVHGPWDYVAKIARWARRGARIHHYFNVESIKALILAALAFGIARARGARYSIGFVGGPRQRYLDQPKSVGTVLMRVLLQRADFIICNNEAVANRLRHHGVRPERIHAIESFHIEQIRDIGSIPPHVAAFAQVHTPLLASVILPRRETGDPHHEVRLLMTAVRRLRADHPNVGCVVMGGADCVEHYRHIIGEAGLGEYFLLPGEVPHAQCLAVMRRADVFVRAYKKDGNSSSVREALALGVPTVAARNPQHPPVAILFEQDDAASLTAVLRDTLSRADEIRSELTGASGVEAAAIDRELALFTNGRL